MLPFGHCVKDVPPGLLGLTDTPSQYRESNFFVFHDGKATRDGLLRGVDLRAIWRLASLGNIPGQR